MRLVSQDKVVDVPYENGALSLSYGVKDVVINYHCSYATKGTELAKYSSQEKALKAMEMVRDKYLHEKSYDDGKGGVLYATRNSSMSTVFQFLKDDEIEV